MNGRRRAGVLVALTHSVCAIAIAQWVGVDPSFPADSAPSDVVRAVALQADGGLLVGGSVTNETGWEQRYLARLDAHGVLDLSFVPELDNDTARIYPLAGGDILISGYFTNVNGTFRPGLARLHQDGSLDEGFTPPPGPNSVYGLGGVPGPEGAVFVTGVFTNLGGQPRNRLARLMSDGSVDPNFLSPFTPTNTISVVAVQPDGKPLISGSFSNVAGVSANGLVRLSLDGSVDPAFRSGLLPQQKLFRAVLQPDGRLVAAVSGENDNAILATSPRRLVRFESDGALDPAFLVTLDNPVFPSASQAYCLALQPDGKILVSGSFLRVNGTPRGRIARLEADGTIDYCFDVEFCAELLALALVPNPDGSILVGGLFQGLQGEWRPNLIRLIPPTGCDPGVIEMAVPTVLARDDEGRVVVPVVRRGGADVEQTVEFDTRDGTAVGGLDFVPVTGMLHFARGERSQSIDVPLIQSAGVNGLRTFEVRLQQAGGEATLGGLTNTVVILTDAPMGSAGAPDTNYAVQLDGPVNVILPLPDGSAMIAGAFKSVNGQPCPDLARLRADGSLDAGFRRTQALDGRLWSMAMDAQGRLLLAGRFRHVDGVERPGLARLGLDGALDEGFAAFEGWPTNLIYAVEMQAVCVLTDGSIVCGGSVPEDGYSLRHGLFKFSERGELDTAFSAGQPPRVTTSALTPLPNGGLLVRGEGLGGSLVRLGADGVIDFGFSPPSDRQFASFYTDTLGLLPDGRVTVAGGLDPYDVLPELPLFWRYNPDGSLDTGFSIPPAFGPLGALRDVELLSVAADGRVLIAGVFAMSGGSIPTLAMLHADGSPDWSFDSGTGLTAISPDDYLSPSALAALPSGGWLIGGSFGGYDGFDQPYLVKVLPETTTRPATFRLTFANLTLEETNAPLRVEVWRRGDASGPASVTLRTEDGTAVGGEDFVPLDERLEFAPGEWIKTVDLTLLDDQLVEDVEDFTLRLADPTDGSELVTPFTATVQIRSDDSNVEFIADGFSGVEEDGFARVAVNWSGVLSDGMQAVVQVVPVTGQSEDLGLTSIVIPYSRRSTNWFKIPIAEDAEPEGTETFRLELVGSANVIPGPRGVATLAIVDHDFNTSPARGVAGIVEAIAHAPQGGVYLAGDFTGVHGVARTRVARLSPDGEVDLGFDPRMGPNGKVTALGVQSNGQVVIAGDFTMVDGEQRVGVARLDADGALDPSFDPGFGAQHTNATPFIRVVLPRDDGSVLIGGAFTHFDGWPSRLLVRLNANGRVDPAFVSALTDGGLLALPLPPRSGAASAVHALVAQPDGKLLAGGRMGISSVPVSVVRLLPDGQIDADFAIITVPRPVSVWSLALTEEGRIQVGSAGIPHGGWLGQPEIANTNWIAIERFDSNGHPDPSFQIRDAPQIPFDASGVRQLLVQPDGRILFAAGIYGPSQEQPGGPVLNLAVFGRLLPDGAWDSGFAMQQCALSELRNSDEFWFDDPSADPETSAPVSTAWLARQPGGVLVLAGAFYAVNGEPRRRLARLAPDGALHGRLNLELRGSDPLQLSMPGEVEVPYWIETSFDLEHWKEWLFIGYPWRPVDLWLPTDEPVHFYRARQAE